MVEQYIIHSYNLVQLMPLSHLAVLPLSIPISSVLALLAYVHFPLFTLGEKKKKKKTNLKKLKLQPLQNLCLDYINEIYKELSGLIISLTPEKTI